MATTTFNKYTTSTNGGLGAVSSFLKRLGLYNRKTVTLKGVPMHAHPADQSFGFIKVRVARLQRAAIDTIRRNSYDEYDGGLRGGVCHIWRANRKDVDGVWECGNCRLENGIVQIPGEHPFGFLKCKRCRTAWNAKMPSTHTLLPFDKMASISTQNAYMGSENIPSGVVCGECGLTHRDTPMWEGRVAFRNKCPCGASHSRTWTRFVIGSNKDYRYGDPDALYAESLKHRLKVSTSRPVQNQKHRNFR
ncbi:hypothetical protein EJ04DRAFT_518656 [Polyplosphaeria fusca]|uniref:Probable double zinc ribbon domain-containing protein n=1 Tax=Polyplosphaeria fusca TaxID=682080 RepID=A0A9P4R921_9PLEO|nr:hypothetical protein EJ04DRAFT_518656 [Polyplosphaeria fusca]